MRTTAIIVGAAVAAAIVAGAAKPAAAASAPAGATIWVATGAGCSDTAAATRTSPLCTLARAASLAEPGDTVMVRAGAYAETLAPRRSGTASAPIRFTAAEAGVSVGSGRPAGINLQGVHDLRFSGLTVTAASKQGVWVSGSARVSFSGLAVKANQGPGFQLKDTTDVSVEHSVVLANRGVGIMELGGVVRGRYLSNTIDGNGHDGQPFNGDGMILNGAGAIVRGNTITANGDDNLYEHGIYASKAATGYLVEANTFSRNSATGVKAQGSGTVRGNTFGASRYGMWVDSSSRTGVAITANRFNGPFTLTAVGKGAGARVKLTANKLGGGVR
jgi:polygalacturonase